MTVPSLSCLWCDPQIPLHVCCDPRFLLTSVVTQILSYSFVAPVQLPLSWYRSLSYLCCDVSLCLTSVVISVYVLPLLWYHSVSYLCCDISLCLTSVVISVYVLPLLWYQSVSYLCHCCGWVSFLSNCVVTPWVSLIHVTPLFLLLCLWLHFPSCLFVTPFPPHALLVTPFSFMFCDSIFPHALFVTPFSLMLCLWLHFPLMLCLWLHFP